MNPEIVFTFPNTHNAMAGEKALMDRQVDVRVMARPSALGDGCGICLRVDPQSRVQAEEVLRECGVEVDGMYEKSRVDGSTCYEPLHKAL